MRECVRFLLGHEPRELSRVDPTMTVLDWLRGSRSIAPARRKAAPKAIAAPARSSSAGRTASELRLPGGEFLHPVLPTLDGCQLFTVEDLKAPTARCIRCSRRWSTPRLAVRLLHAGFRDVAVRLHHGGKARTPRPTRHRRRACRAISAAAPATGPIIEAAPGACRRGPRARACRAETPTRWPQLRERDDARRRCRVRQRRLPRAAHARRPCASCCARIPRRHRSRGGTDVGLWVTKQYRELDDDHLHRPRSTSCSASTTRRDAIEIGAGGHLHRRAWPALGRARIPTWARSDAALRLAARSATPARSAATSPTARRSATALPC